MTIHISPDYDHLSQHTADFILSLIKNKPNAILCFATGNTPVRAYQLFVDQVKREKVNVSNIRFVGLDEWVGVPGNVRGSCKHFFQTELFSPLDINPANTFLFDGEAADLDAECVKMNGSLDKLGPIDLMLVGIGPNGHIGFNEPGTPRNLSAHVSKLADQTVVTGQKYFDNQMQLKYGLTLGLRNFIEAREAIIMANGEGKANIIHQTVEGPDTIEIPSTIIRHHRKGCLFLDKAAANKITS